MDENWETDEPPLKKSKVCKTISESLETKDDGLNLIEALCYKQENGFTLSMRYDGFDFQ